MFAGSEGFSVIVEKGQRAGLTRAFRFSAVSLAAWASAIRIRLFSCSRSIRSVLRLTSMLLVAVSCSSWSMTFWKDLRILLELGHAGLSSGGKAERRTMRVRLVGLVGWGAMSLQPL
ncbi:hypothetical protein X970_17255 [Pseudomonas monteilii SB3101]|uniref:Uncharacterized protein n=1 Tax=Pseudomonas monteilii SB3101 TaxID=1435058 RepID=V9VB65_9PSED|nr:hypothetical protein X969_17610 [Pseudomonas monteilii SB3078]AHC91150.1 hypothetical protein X970_17255 [Pseudomonas monteilii SB3101]